MINSLDVIINILKKHGVCMQNEIMRRAIIDYDLKRSAALKAIKYLYSKNIICMQEEDAPYRKNFNFYYMSKLDPIKRDDILSSKLDLSLEHSKHTIEIGNFGEQLVGRISEELGYEEITIQKGIDLGFGLGRRKIDVWGEHPFGEYYQNFEVKNRRQPVNINDLDNLEFKTSIASDRWGLPVKSALVCSFIYPKTALKYAKSNGIPVVITQKQFVPVKYGDFYKEYKVAFRSDYIELVTLEDPPGYLIDLIENYIVLHEYDER